MHPCEWCHCVVPVERGSIQWTGPDGRIYDLCAACRTAARTGDLSTAPAETAHRLRMAGFEPPVHRPE